MAPSPEDDNAPKAPDKSDKNKCNKVITEEIVKEKDKEEKVQFSWLFFLCQAVLILGVDIRNNYFKFNTL